MEFDIAHSQASFKRPHRQLYWKTAITPEMAYSYDDDSPHPEWTVSDPAFAQDASHYLLDNYKDELTQIDDAVSEVKSDYAFNAGDQSRGWGAKLGLKYRNNVRAYDSTRRDLKWEGQEPLSLENFIDPVNYTPEHFPYSMFMQDEQAIFSYLADNSDKLQWDRDQEIYNNINGDFRFDEDVYASYAMATYSSEGINLFGGIRYEATRVKNSGQSYDQQTEIFTPNSTNTSYDNVLPSINITFKLEDNVNLRLAFSKAIGRVEPGHTKAREISGMQDNEMTISRSNPDLQPRESDNYDLSLENYFADANGLFSLALFHKRIKNLIFASKDETFDADTGITTIISQSKNAEASQVTGLEFGLVLNSFNSLPAPFQTVGVSANATWLDAKMTYHNTSGQSVTIDHLVNQADFMANLTLFYRFHQNRGEARVAYNYTDQYSRGLSINSLDRNENVWAPYEQVDAQVRYQLTDGLVLKAMVRNLRNHLRARYVGYGQSLVEHEIVFGRSLWFGMSYSY